MSKIKSINPTNYKLLGEVEVSTEDEIKEAFLKAKKAQKNWKELGLEKRVEVLRKLVAKIEERKGEIAELVTKEMGMPIGQSLSEDVGSGIAYFKWYLDNAAKYLSPEVTFEDETSISTVFYEPAGVAAVISPWNYPVCNFVWGVGQNLIAGNCVVFKHSEETPLVGKLIEEIVRESNLPEGVFSEVYGDGTVGDFLTDQEIDLICFTGSVQVGEILYKKAAEKFIKIVLELGGSAPGIVFEDADLDKALDSIYFARFSNCGQMCDGLKRLIVDKSRVDEVIERLSQLLKSKKVGDPMNEDTDIGPLVAERQLKLLEEQVEDAVEKGAKVICGGKRVEGVSGFFYEPTILTNLTKEMRVWKEEVFGPVLPVISFEDAEQALRMANDTKYGLGAYVYSEDKEKSLRVALEIESGMVSINGVNYVMPANPFGGYKRSGLGREHGKFGFYEVTVPKIVAMEK